MPRIACELVMAYVFRPTETGPEFLVLHRRQEGVAGGTWQTVYGHIRPGETSWQTALREIQEETGLRPVRFYQLDTVDTFYLAAEDVIHHCPCFAAEMTPAAEVRLNEEHTTFEWLPAAAAATRYTWPGQRRAVREIMSEIIEPGPATAWLEIPVPSTG